MARMDTLVSDCLVAELAQAHDKSFVWAWKTAPDSPEGEKTLVYKAKPTQPSIILPSRFVRLIEKDL